MAEFPALAIWTDAYLADCSHLSDAEHGVYFQLLMLMWRSPQCRIPNDDEWLARKFRRDANAVRTQMRPLITEFCQASGQWITQKRLQREWQWCMAKREKNSASAKQRWGKGNEPCERSADAMPDAQCERNAPTPTPTPKKKEANASIPLPPWIPNEEWNAYLEVRQKLRAPNTPNAISLLVTKLTKLRDAGHDPQKVIEQSIERGWRSFFQLKGDTDENSRRQSSPSPTKDERARAAVMRAAAAGGFAPTPES